MDLPFWAAHAWDRVASICRFRKYLVTVTFSEKLAHSVQLYLFVYFFYVLTLVMVFTMEWNQGGNILHAWADGWIVIDLGSTEAWDKNSSQGSDKLSCSTSSSKLGCCTMMYGIYFFTCNLCQCSTIAGYMLPSNDTALAQIWVMGYMCRPTCLRVLVTSNWVMCTGPWLIYMSLSIFLTNYVNIFI